MERLEAHGLRVCIDYRDFVAGAPIVTEMERAVLTAVLLFSVRRRLHLLRLLHAITTR